MLMSDASESRSGAQRVVTVDLHAGQIQGFFNCPVDNLYARPVLLKRLSALSGDIVMVSPDAGGVERARSFAKKMDAALAVIDKRRDRPNQVAEMHIVGDVSGKIAILVDDMIDTAGTMVAGMKALVTAGAKSVHICATHGLLSGPAVERLEGCEIIEEVVLCDTVPIPPEKRTAKINVITVGPLIARAIANVFNNDSISELFDPDFAL